MSARSVLHFSCLLAVAVRLALPDAGNTNGALPEHKKNYKSEAEKRSHHHQLQQMAAVRHCCSILLHTKMGSMVCSARA